MAAAPLNLSCAKGEAVTFTGTHVASASDLTPQDISGWTMVFTATAEDGTVILNKSVSVVSGPAGTYSWSVTHADTLVDFNAYGCDIWRTDTGSETLMGFGKFRVTREVKY